VPVNLRDMTAGFVCSYLAPDYPVLTDIHHEGLLPREGGCRDAGVKPGGVVAETRELVRVHKELRRH
jgi:hypothetical protein